MHPGASRDKIVVIDGTLHVYVTSRPVESQANEALIALLAKQSKIAKSKFLLLKGHKSRDKLVLVDGHDDQSVLQRLALRPD